MTEFVNNIILDNSGTRSEVRMRLIAHFADEEPGVGSGELASKQTYYVETLESGDRIYLRRPANLHNGFDFLVCVEGHNFATPGSRARNFPKHDDIVSDLENKRNEDSEQYARLYELMIQVFECHNVAEVDMRTFTFENGYSAEMILKTIKWLFIEQDIRYWNYSGRAMLWDGIPRPE